jgi:hypothetical protein
MSETPTTMILPNADLSVDLSVDLSFEALAEEEALAKERQTMNALY